VNSLLLTMINFNDWRIIFFNLQSDAIQSYLSHHQNTTPSREPHITTLPFRPPLCFQRQDESEEEAAEKKEEEEEKPDPLKQLITCLSRAATKEQQSSMPEDSLYISYAQIMSQVGASLCLTASIKLRLLFSPCRLWFLRASLFLRII